MGFMDELKKLARPYAEDDEDDYDDYDNDDFEDEEDEAPEPAPRARRSAPAFSVHTTAQLQVVLVKPERFDNVSEIAEHLRERRAVVLNLESTNKDVARRLVDFLSGCAYALDGKIKKVAANTYIITPYSVDIMGDLIDELENNGLYL